MDHHLLNMDGSQHLYKHYDDGYSPINCRITLKNKELWRKFHDLETEMIITKSGRRMFPSLHVQIEDLDPHAHYCILLEVTPAAHCRYKYTVSGGWAPAGTEEVQSPQRVYFHPESPATGEYWMSQPVSFGRLKLTNTSAPPVGHIVLSSMHKYQPRIIIAKTSDPRAIAWAPSSSVVFPETQFIAVTAYQNEKITKLKIDNNPFAKGFRENGQSKSKRKRILDEGLSEDEKPVKQVKVEDLPSPKIENDAVSISSGSSSPEQYYQRGSLSPTTSPRFSPSYPAPYIYKPYIATSMLNIYSNYYYPHYPAYYAPSILGARPHFYYHQPLISPPVAEDLRVQEPAVKQPKKLTDFSIKAITGCL